MAFVVFSPHTFSPSSHSRQPGSPEPAGLPSACSFSLSNSQLSSLRENCLCGLKAFLPHHERVSVLEAKADTFVSFYKCWEATLLLFWVPPDSGPGSWTVVICWLRLNRQVQVPFRKCVWILNWQGEVLGVWGAGAERGREKERERTALLFFVLTNPVL